MKTKKGISRRSVLTGAGCAGLLAFVRSDSVMAQVDVLGAPLKFSGRSKDVWEVIHKKVMETPIVDTHEHIFDERDRLTLKDDDWTVLLGDYSRGDMEVVGMPPEKLEKFFGPNLDPVAKWKVLEPYWPGMKNTGYSICVRIAFRELYGVDELNERTVGKIHSEFKKLPKPGFYRHILRDMGNIESCQVNCVSSKFQKPFDETTLPDLCMQDLGIVGMFMLGDDEFKRYRQPTGIDVKDLSDWHRVIDWWFKKYGPYAVAAKAQHAYSRGLDHEQVPAERVEGIFKKFLNQDDMTGSEHKALQDHLFWYVVGQCNKYDLTVKLHTGYMGNDTIPERIRNNPVEIAKLCRLSPQTTFDMFHICYPHYEELIGLAKAIPNLKVDMCWAWNLNAIAAKDFLKKFLITSPANKVLTFGGDYFYVEASLGCVAMARRGITLALTELVNEGWFSLDDALVLSDLIMYKNAHEIFGLDRRKKNLENPPWRAKKVFMS
jgi:predicted TIM-barrel fold metal-dependent hydrolase